MVNLAVSHLDDDDYGVGVEICKKTDKGIETYYIASLYLSRRDFPSVRSLLPYVFSLIIPEVNEQDELVIFNSTIRYFRNQFQELKRKAGVYLGGKRACFKWVQRLQGDALILAQDAVKRKTTITERLERE